jgi:hypothetical protein
VAALVADVLLVELELRGGFRGRMRPASRAMSPTSRSLASSMGMHAIAGQFAPR